ncbi:hypothetical protein GGP86_001437 [Salinibacter ruber]|nr:hypothetical protein [Salinibacter ruber]
MWSKSKIRAWSEVKRILGRYPKIYYALGSFRGDVFQKRRVSEDADIVIEGYPRSASSFAVGAFRYAQSASINVAHHLHVPAQIVRGCELGIPTILLVRHPVDAVVSHRALRREGEMVDGRRRETLSLGFESYFWDWICFYKTTLGYIDYLVVSLFGDVIQDFGSIVEAVNSKYGSSFGRFEHTEENVAHVNKNRGYHAGPSERREKIKEEVRANLERYRQDSGDVIDGAIELYEIYKQESSVI